MTSDTTSTRAYDFSQEIEHNENMRRGFIQNPNNQNNMRVKKKHPRRQRDTQNHLKTTKKK